MSIYISANRNILPNRTMHNQGQIPQNWPFHSLLLLRWFISPSTPLSYHLKDTCYGIQDLSTASSTTGPAVPPQHSPGSLFPLLHPPPPRWDQRAFVALPGLKEVGIMKGGKRILYSCSKFHTCASFLLLPVVILRVCDQNIATKYQQSNATKVDLFVALKITSLGCCGLP